jgi:thiol-disulfide isomerase/thioredoxin
VIGDWLINYSAMKKIILFITVTLFHVVAFAQDQFTFSGNIIGGNNLSARLSYQNEKGTLITDSGSLQNGSFVFKGSINGVSRSTLIIYSPPYQPKNISEKNMTTVFLEKGDVSAIANYDNLKEIKVIGSKSHDEWLALEKRLHEKDDELEPISKNFSKLYREFNEAKQQKKSKEILDSLENRVAKAKKLIDPFSSRYENIVREFVFTHPNSYISPMQMGTYVSSWPIDSVRLAYNQFSPSVQNTNAGKIIKKEIDAILSRSTNTPAINFTIKDINGKTLSLNNFKGKYVLLDFWGSWCLPCRESTPHLIKVFKKYNKSGLEIIGVAADDTESSWRRAIKTDKTDIWHNVLTKRKPSKNGVKGFYPIVDDYAIGGFPTKILIDKNGTIIGRYIGTQDADLLDKKLAEVFNM